MLMKYSFKKIAALSALVLCIGHSQVFGIITSYSRNDSYPVFTTLDPQTFLQTREKNALKGICLDPYYYDEWFSLSISPFAQNSNSMRNDCLVTPLPISPDIMPCYPKPPCDFICTDTDGCLGNVNGRWSMIGLLLGNIPEGASRPPLLEEALNELQATCGDINVQTCSEAAVQELTPQYIDRKGDIGFFDVPMRYKKRGIRFDLKGRIASSFGFTFNVGLADISQTIGFYDRTGSVTQGQCLTINNCVQVCGCTLEKYLMEKLQDIAPQICLDIDDFHKFSVEDLRAGVFWRQAFEFNTNSRYWEQFLLIPFMHLEASFPVGEKRNYQRFAALSFGSNDHLGFGFSTGLNVDFTQTIEIGGEFGCTHFFPRDVCSMPIPTSIYQSGIYPFSRAVKLSPGNNWHFGLKMQAYHFLGNLSFYFQYVLVDHMQDHIKLQIPDDAFLPEVLEDISAWKNQLANIGFNYDIAPDVSLGFLWQTPFPSVGTYRSTTVMLSFNAQY